ncbi:hypothetical protein [Methylobacterium sp. J-076]|uniref:hypothetical protein n=1 Tax=Methylobacterium sp. J-076 TaxID=2836655 RepID=UPI001FB94214|nr:hypothetical protein [Methylobacterium sp. J-076]MCJ2014765.1 hypothetical protein [Methylobacterium sp. J-076]
MGTDIDAAREAFGMVPPGPAPGEETKTDGQGAAGPTSPGGPESPDDQGPASGGYDNRPPLPSDGNRKGGYGAG